MKTQQLAQREAADAYVVVLEDGDRAIESLVAAASEHGIKAGEFTGLGAFSHTTLAFFDRESREYLEFEVADQVEVLSLMGNIGVYDGAPRVHAHVLLGFPDGSVRGGHLVEATVWPTLEISVTSWPGVIERQATPGIGLPLISAS